ncbi:MAG: DDE-type integrase/transposase/recombinase [Anaerolineae bacterium]|nr:DDE-type integrase/transposase/recombinase [Anaerolineae bacterium]
MSTEDQMTIDERRKYLRRMKKRYRQANRKEQGHLLDEMEAVTELHRKSLIRLMNGSLERTPRLTQRGRTYGPETDDALRVIAESLDYICAQRLTPNLVWMAQHLAAHGELRQSPELLQQLDRISVSTVQRTLARIRQDERRLPRKGPERANQATRGIPMKRIPWNETQPGHFEVDLVHHSGPSPSGQYVHTLQMIDVTTGWSERVAVLGRSYCVMQDGFRRALARLPFSVRGIHPDNGTEFFNHHLLRFWGHVADHIELSRSRPFHKNDNPFVEQKNATLVRAYLGNERLDTVVQTLVLNQLYDKMWLYYNFFQPVMRLVEKIIIPAGEGQPARTKRRYDQPRTPFDRLCETDAIQEEEQQRLEALRDRTNPRTLRREIYELIDYLFSLPNAIEGQTENVHETLTFPLEFYEKGADASVTFSFDTTITLR